LSRCIDGDAYRLPKSNSRFKTYMGMMMRRRRRRKKKEDGLRVR
jgi:hypothetical protein